MRRIGIFSILFMDWLRTKRAMVWLALFILFISPHTHASARCETFLIRTIRNAELSFFELLLRSVKKTRHKVFAQRQKAIIFLSQLKKDTKHYRRTGSNESHKKMEASLNELSLIYRWTLDRIADSLKRKGKISRRLSDLKGLIENDLFYYLVQTHGNDSEYVTAFFTSIKIFFRSTKEPLVLSPNSTLEKLRKDQIIYTLDYMTRTLVRGDSPDEHKKLLGRAIFELALIEATLDPTRCPEIPSFVVSAIDQLNWRTSREIILGDVTVLLPNPTRMDRSVLALAQQRVSKHVTQASWNQVPVGAAGTPDLSRLKGSMQDQAETVLNQLVGTLLAIHLRGSSSLIDDEQVSAITTAVMWLKQNLNSNNRGTIETIWRQALTSDGNGSESHTDQISDGIRLFAQSSRGFDLQPLLQHSHHLPNALEVLSNHPFGPLLRSALETSGFVITDD